MKREAERKKGKKEKREGLLMILGALVLVMAIMVPSLPIAGEDHRAWARKPIYPAGFGLSDLFGHYGDNLPGNGHVQLWTSDNMVDHIPIVEVGFMLDATFAHDDIMP